MAESLFCALVEDLFAVSAGSDAPIGAILSYVSQEYAGACTIRETGVLSVRWWVPSRLAMLSWAAAVDGEPSKRQGERLKQSDHTEDAQIVPLSLVAPGAC